VLKQGSFIDADDFHKGSGAATVYQVPDGQDVLRFEDFSVTNGPDLHVILSSNPNPTSSSDIGDDYIDLGSLKGNMGNQNYEIPADIDLANYQSVVIYCMPFHVVFATATLN
ncbi:MAG: DM13 domain-containing protein, partial [Chloroflexota bacterium]